MTIYSIMTIGGSEVTDFKNVKIRKTINESNASSTFEATIDSPYGRHANDYLVGNEISYYTGSQVIYNAGSPIFQAKFNSSGTSVTESINNQIGSFINPSGISFVNGKIGSAVQISGTGFCNFYNNGSLAFTKDKSFSLCAWVYLSGVGPLASSQSQGIIAKGTQSTCNYGIDFVSGTNKLFRFGERSGASNIGVCNSIPINADSWTHVLGVYDSISQNNQIYINNYPGSKISTGGSQFNNTGSFTIGRGVISNNVGSQQVYYLDDVRIYNKALTQTEINQIYKNGNGTEDISPESDILFRGILEKKNFQGEGTTQNLRVSGRDYTLRLQDITIKPIVFSNTEVSDIVNNVLTNNSVPDITTNNVQTTSTTLKRIGFNHTPIFDGLTQLAGLSSPEGYVFYVDTNKDLHFEPSSETDSGITLDNTNLINCNFDKSRQGMANMIYVYGDRYLSAAPTEIFSLGSLTNGSVATLTYKPHNTRVNRLGTILKGSVEGMTVSAVSGTDYAVSFDDKQVIFFSGTGFPNFPTGSVVIDYDKDNPIAKYGQNDLSISLYGPKELKIQDNTIKDPATATAILKEKLRDAEPLSRINCKIKGWYNFIQGNLVTISLPNFNLNETLDIIQIDYDFNKETIQNERIITINLSKKFIDITDKIKELKNRIDSLESQNLQSGDIYTRLFQDNTGSMVLTGSYWSITSSQLTGSVICCASPGLPVPISLLGTLASGTNQKGLAGSPAGEGFTNPVIVFSGT